jgi:hypothetical protein
MPGVDLVRGLLGGVGVGRQQVLQQEPEVLTRAGLLGHQRAGPFRERHRGGQQVVGDLLLLVDGPQVAVGHVLPARGQAEPGQYAEVGRRGSPHRPARRRDPEPLEPPTHLGTGLALEDRALAHVVHPLAVGVEGDQVETAVLQRDRVVEEPGRLVDDVLQFRTHRQLLGG